MRKVLFLMFLLLLMGLGAAGVKAQVRIGGNGAPNAAAVLDLNETDATTGTKGLALPRVALTSNTMQLTSGIANLTGMLVYNTSTTGSGVSTIGIYFWNGATWVQANLPSATARDSGLVLVNTGSAWAAEPIFASGTSPRGPYSLAGAHSPASISFLGTFVWQENVPPTTYIVLNVPGIAYGDWCNDVDDQNVMFYHTATNTVTGFNLQLVGMSSVTKHTVQCWRPA